MNVEKGRNNGLCRCRGRGMKRWIKFVCWFSSRFWDIHDYTVSSGGNGTPTHFYEYTCWNCGKKFGI
jgi:hypothetical protein